jgi:hypothetical protein
MTAANDNHTTKKTREAHEARRARNAVLAVEQVTWRTTSISATQQESGNDDEEEAGSEDRDIQPAQRGLRTRLPGERARAFITWAGLRSQTTPR